MRQLRASAWGLLACGQGVVFSLLTWALCPGGTQTGLYLPPSKLALEAVTVQKPGSLTHWGAPGPVFVSPELRSTYGMERCV